MTDTPDAVIGAHRRRYRRGRTRQAMLVLGDIAAVAIPLFVLQAVTAFPSGDGVPALAVVGGVVIWPVALHLYGLYPRFPRHVATSTLNEFPKIFHAGRS